MAVKSSNRVHPRISNSIFDRIDRIREVYPVNLLVADGC